MGKLNQTPDPLQQVMATVIAGFQQTTEIIQQVQQQQQQLQRQQDSLQQQLQNQTRAAYSGMTASGRTRFVSSLVEQEVKAKGERGAQARVANTLDLTPGRVSQLVNSSRNRENGR